MNVTAGATASAPIVIVPFHAPRAGALLVTLGRCFGAGTAGPDALAVLVTVPRHWPRDEVRRRAGGFCAGAGVTTGGAALAVLVTVPRVTALAAVRLGMTT